MNPSLKNSRRDFLRTSAAAVAATALPSLLRGEPKPAVPGHSTVVVDWHSHFVSPTEIRLLQQRAKAPRVLTNGQGQTLYEGVGTVSSAPREPAAFQVSDIAARLRHLEQAGVQRQLLSVMIPLGYDATLTPEEIRPILRGHNDDLAEVVRQHPAQFHAVAALASSDPEWSAQELERAHRDLGFMGGVLPLNAFTTLEGARTLAQIFKVGQKYGSHFFIHRGPASTLVPGQPPLVVPGDTGYARWSVINNAHMTQGGITLGLTDFLDPYPDVTVQLVMLAGFLPYIIESLVDSAKRVGVGDPLARLRRLYLDPGPYSRNGRWVALAAETLGADRILFGTDYGVNGGVSEDRLTPSIATLDAALTPAQRRQIYVENSVALLKTKGLA